MKFWVLPTLLLCVLDPISSCSARKKTPEGPPELVFPGISTWAAKDASDKTSYILSLFTFDGIIPVAGAGALFDVLNKFRDLITETERALTQFPDSRQSIAALREVKAASEIMRHRFSEIQVYLYKNKDYTLLFNEAWLEAERISDLLADKSSPLYRNGNALVTTPLLVSFIHLYSHTAALRFDNLWDQRPSTVAGLEAILEILRGYKTEAVEKRMTYTQPFQGKQWCFDSFHTVALCPKCFEADCPKGPSNGNEKEMHDWENKNDVTKKFARYKRQLRSLYEEFYSRHIKELETAIEKLKVKIKRSEQRKF